MAEPLVSLNTFLERKVVAIDGQPYELLNPEELSVLDYNRVGRKSLRLHELLQRDDELTAEEVAEEKKLLDFVVRAILVAPDAVHARLTDTHRLVLMNLFSKLQAPLIVARSVEPRTATQKTGESSSRG